MEGSHEIRLEIPSAAEYVSLVRHAIEGIASRMRFDPVEVGDLKLAVGEACNNAVKHGGGTTGYPCIVVVCKVAPTSLEIEVSNALSGGCLLYTSDAADE